MKNIKKLVLIAISLLVMIIIVIACQKENTVDPPYIPEKYEMVFKIGDNYVKEHAVQFSDGAGMEDLPIPPMYEHALISNKYEEMRGGIKFSGNTDVAISINDMNMSPSDSQLSYFDNYVVFTRGEYMNSITLHVTRNPIKAEKLEISLSSDNNEIEIGKSKMLHTSYTPSNTSYKNTIFRASKIVTADNETVIGEELDKYVTVTSNGSYGELNTTKLIGVGYKLYVMAFGGDGPGAEEGIESNELIVEVVRTKVSRISIVTDNNVSAVKPGTALGFRIVLNSDATWLLEDKEPEVKLDETTNWGLITGDFKNNYVLTVDSSAPVYANIKINVVLEDGGVIVKEMLSLYISDVPLTGLKLADENGIELDKNNNIKPGESRQIKILTVPSDATVDNVKILTTQPRYVTIENGIMTVSDDAPIDLEFGINAVFEHITSISYRFTVNKIPVESVELIADRLQARPGQRAVLSTNIVPKNATYQHVDYEVVQGQEYATINYNYLDILKTTPIGAVVEVVAKVDGVTSNTICIDVIPQGIQITADKSTVIAGDNSQINVFMGSNILSTVEVDFELLEGANYAYISDGTLYTDPNIEINNAKVSIRASYKPEKERWEERQ